MVNKNSSKVEKKYEFFKSFRVINKELQVLDHFETTYNFEVEDNHNYYVSEECILVHNECHHIISNKGKKGEEIADLARMKYGRENINLNKPWNTKTIFSHKGRHTNAYHDMVRKVTINAINKYDDVNGFYNEIIKLGNLIEQYDGCLRKCGENAIAIILEILKIT